MKILMRKPGYAMQTGVLVHGDIYLIYLLRASFDQKKFYLTLK